ncbi:MAG: hypothetical protein U0838_04205 [Chloroflexota bacterium]
MIETLAQAEQALTMGLLDRAEALFRAVAEADPDNSMAVAGLARVALEHADDAGALRLAWRAWRSIPATTQHNGSPRVWKK